LKIIHTNFQPENVGRFENVAIELFKLLFYIFFSVKYVKENNGKLFLLASLKAGAGSASRSGFDDGPFLLEVIDQCSMLLLPIELLVDTSTKFIEVSNNLFGSCKDGPTSHYFKK
jgi:hypothetical protein